MEITLEQILEAIGKKPELLDGLIKPVFESEKGKTEIAKKVTTEVDAKIDGKLAEVYNNLDNIAFTVLGEKPGEKDGKKVKTSEFLEEKLKELKVLVDKKGGLEKDPEIQRLTQEIETLKTQGGGAFIQQQFEQAKADWAKEKQILEGKIEDANKTATDGQKKTEITSAFAALKFSPDVDEEIRKVILGSAEADLMAKSEIIDGKLVFKGADGKPLFNPVTNEPKTAAEILAETAAIQKITLKDNPGGGGAAPSLPGSIKVVQVEGKDSKKLVLDPTQFKTRSEFVVKAEEALKKNGITMRDPDWTKLKNDAYIEHNVDKLPLE